MTVRKKDLKDKPISSEKRSGQDFMRGVGIKSVGEDFAGMEDSSL